MIPKTTAKPKRPKDEHWYEHGPHSCFRAVSIMPPRCGGTVRTEIDPVGRVGTIRADRIKVKRVHRVPCAARPSRFSMRPPWPTATSSREQSGRGRRLLPPDRAAVRGDAARRVQHVGVRAGLAGRLRPQRPRRREPDVQPRGRGTAPQQPNARRHEQRPARTGKRGLVGSRPATRPSTVGGGSRAAGQ